MMVGSKKYVNLHDLAGIIQRKYNQPDLPLAEFDDVVRGVVTGKDDLIFTKRFRARTHRGVSLYTAQTMIEMNKAEMIVTRIGYMLQEPFVG
jgi:hypothetical protein